MGTALLKGWIAHKVTPIVVVEPAPSPALRQLVRGSGVRLCRRLEDVDPGSFAVCVIALKPQILKTEGARLQAFAAAGALLVSIAAGTSTKHLAGTARARVIRAMPNLPGAIGRGISALYATSRATESDRRRAESLLAALGDVVWVRTEAMIDAVTAVSGSGPAYVFLLAEALARAGEAVGLPPALSTRLARATVEGAGALLEADKRPAAALRRDVTSPGGTTEAALAVLTKGDAFDRLLERAVGAARRRARELGT